MYLERHLLPEDDWLKEELPDSDTLDGEFPTTYSYQIYVENMHKRAHEYAVMAVNCEKKREQAWLKNKKFFMYKGIKIPVNKEEARETLNKIPIQDV